MTPKNKRFRYGIILTVVLILCWHAGANAQTTFKWSNKKLPNNMQHSLEICMALNNRLNDSIHARDEVDRDTFRYADERRFREEQFAEVRLRVNECMAKFDPTAVPRRLMRIAIQLYLIADEDQKAAELIEQQLSMIDSDSTALMAAILDTSIHLYAQASPARLKSAMTLLPSYIAVQRHALRLDAVRVYDQLSVTANGLGDSVTHDSIFRLTLNFVKSIPKDDWESKPYGAVGSLVVYNQIMNHHSAQFLDSLGLRTEILPQLIDTLFYQYTEHRNMLHDMMSSGRGIVGKSFPIIPSEAMWRPREAGNVHYPRRGKVTLVGLVPVGYESQGFNALVRRLSTANKEMDVVLVSQTRGYVGPLEPPSPEQEADLIERLFKDHLRLPGQLAVMNTPFFRIEGLDRRRVDTPGPMDDLGFGVPGRPKFYILDKEGVIASDSFRGERRLEAIIPLLINRPYRDN